MVPWWAVQQQHRNLEEGRSDNRYGELREHEYASDEEEEEDEDEVGEEGRGGGPFVRLVRFFLSPILKPLTTVLHKAHSHVGFASVSRSHRSFPGDGTARTQSQRTRKKKAKEEEGWRVLQGPRVYACGFCRMHLATDMEVVSRVRRCGEKEGKGGEGRREGGREGWRE